MIKKQANKAKPHQEPDFVTPASPGVPLASTRGRILDPALDQSFDLAQGFK